MLQGLLNIAGHPCVAYDPSGAVFAVVLNLRSTVMLYDIRNFDKQPFLCTHIEDPILSQRSFPPRTPVYTSVSFSNDGKWLLVGTSGDVHYVLDSFDGNLLARLERAFFVASDPYRDTTRHELLVQCRPIRLPSASSAHQQRRTIGQWSLPRASRARS